MILCTHHPLAVLGLALNMAGALMLLWFPPHNPYLANGQWVGGAFAGPETPEGLRAYRRFKWGFRIAILLFLLGFALQLIDLLIA